MGIEWLMAVASYPQLGYSLWKRSGQEQYSLYGTSVYYENIVDSPYRKMDRAKHHFISVPGILAFFYYPGSVPFLFLSMFLLGLLAAGIELCVYKLSGANIILCSLLAQVMAYRYVHFGYVPAQSHLLLGSILLNVLIIFLLNKVLVAAMDKKAVSP